MKCLYLDVGGFVNSLLKLALKRLIYVHKPCIFFITEPWMTFDDFPPRWLTRLGLKLFAVNNKNDMEINIWC